MVVHGEDGNNDDLPRCCCVPVVFDVVVVAVAVVVDDDDVAVDVLPPAKELPVVIEQPLSRSEEEDWLSLSLSL